VDDNLDFNFSELDFSYISIDGDLAFKSIGSQISRLFDEFERELGGMKGVDAVELNNTVLEKVEFHIGVLMAVGTEVHSEDVVLDLD